MTQLLLYIDAGALVFLFIIAIVAALIIGPLIWVSVIVYKSLSNMGYRWLALVLAVCVLSYIFYTVYTSIYPTDDFYYDEFKTVTLRSVPKSAIVINKTASYPDFHGDYCSVSLIKLSKRDYNILLNEIKADKRLHKGQIIRSAELDEVMGKNLDSQVQYVFDRNIPNEQDHYLTIIFLKDKQSIVVNVCVT